MREPSTLRPFRFGVIAALARSADEWIATARQAEDLGYATFLVPDTLGHSFAPFPALAAVATATRAIRLGTYVLANDLRHPALLAHECATLDLLSNGRFELGLGAGRPTAGEDYQQLQIPFASGGVRVARLGEALPMLKTLLSGAPLSFSGRHYAVMDARVFPAPVQQPHPPILVAGAGRRLLTLAAREADIVAIAAQPNEREAAIAEKVGWLRQAAGARFAQLELHMNVTVLAPGLPQQALAWAGIDADEAIRSGAPSIVWGEPEQMRDQLLARRASLGISYIAIAGDFMQAFAPVVALLAGA